jgi:peptide chain release factor subunit 3
LYKTRHGTARKRGKARAATDTATNMSSGEQPPANDWEQAADSTPDPASLAEQTSRMNISAQAPVFRPQASTFVLGGVPFYPQQPYYAQQQQQQQGGYQPQYAGYPPYNQHLQYNYHQGGHGGYDTPHYAVPRQQQQQQTAYQPLVLQRGQTPPTAASAKGTPAARGL